MTSILSEFPGNLPHSHAWPLALRNFYDYLANATPAECGLLGEAMTAAQYAAATESADPFVPVQAPGAEPDHTPASAWNRWKYISDAHSKNQQSIKDAKTAIIATLDRQSRDLLEEPLHGTRRRTLLQIVTILNDAYGILSANDIMQMQQVTLQPLGSLSRLLPYIQMHRHMAATLATVGQQYPPAIQYRQLRDGVKSTPALLVAIAHYEVSNSTVLLQTFEGLATALIATANNTDDTLTTGSQGYVAASYGLGQNPDNALAQAAAAQIATGMAAAATPSMEDRIVERVTAQMVRLMNDTAPRQPQKQPKKPFDGKAYCHTHGAGHSGKTDCINPGPNHKADATMAKKMGGSTKNC